MVACNSDDRPALRWLLGHGSNDFRSGQYLRLQRLCEETNLSPWDALERCRAGALDLSRCTTLKRRFDEIRDAISRILELDSAVEILDHLFPPDDDAFAPIRELFADEIHEDTELDDVRAIVLEKMYEPNYPDKVEYVRVMTLYGSKGLGSPIVYLTSLVDGLLPRFPDEGDDRQTVEANRQEQRRLFYVALTRVKATPDKPGELTISSFRQFEHAEAFDLNNGNLNAVASRFLSELGPRAPRAVRR